MGNLQTKKTPSKASIKNTRPYAHNCDKCKACKINSTKNKCSACQYMFLENLYKDFSSGNKVVDEIIKNPIYIPPNNDNDNNGSLNYYEWIPWERFSNIKEIGRGGFGIIYKATLIDGLFDVESIKHHSSMEYKRGRTNNFEEKIDEVAIKIIPTNSSEVFKELNLQRVMFSKRGDYLIGISLIWGITQNAETLEYGIVMEFAPEGDMRKYLSKNFHSTSWQHKLLIARQIAFGLDYIRFSGMVHRDLHSGNILQLESFQVNICDLGLCQPINNEATTTAEEKKIFGVIPYIPPEVLRGKKFTSAGDIYSFAMLLWELATGKPPFYDCSHDHILIMGIISGQRPKITSSLIPPSIAKIIVKCWDPIPKNRPTAEEVYRKLGKLSYTNSEFRESDKYLKEMAEGDDSMTTSIHSGAVYTSRVLSAQMVDFSKELVYLPEDVSLFMNIELANLVAGGFGSTSTGLGNWPDIEKKVRVSVVDSSARPLGLADIGVIDGKFLKSWGSEIESKTSSISSLSDLENIKNIVTKETSYINSDNSVVDSIEDNAMFKKTCTHTYVLVALPPSKFKDSNQLPSIKSCASEKRNFRPVKSFILDIELSAIPEKSVDNKLISIKKIFYQVDSFGGAFTPSKFSGIIRLSFTLESNLNKVKILVVSNKILVNDDLRKKVIVKKIPVDFFRSVMESVFSKFGKIILIKMQLIGLWQKVIIEFELFEVASLVASRWDWHRALLYTLPVGTMAHDFSVLVEAYGTGPSPGAKFSVGAWFFSNSADSYGVSSLFDCLAFLEWSLELLTDQVSGIVKKLSFVELVSLPPIFYELPLATATPLATEVNSDMVLDDASEPSAFFFSAVVDDTFGFSSNSFKILTTKMGELELKMIGLVWKFATCNVWCINVLAKQVNVVCWHISSRNMIKDKYDGVWIFISGLDIEYLGTGVAVVMNNFLAHYVSKIEVIPNCVVSIWLLFKNKLLVSVLSLYTNASTGVHFEQASKVNSIIAKTVNTSTFVVLSGDFNECGSGKSASFKFCSGLGLVNLFNGHYLIKAPTWCNSRGAERTIDYIFVSESLFSVVVKHWVGSVSDFFNINHNVVVVLVGLTNKDCWKFKIKDVDSAGWSRFRDCSFTRILEIKDRFLATAAGHDLDAMWSLLEGMLVSSADEIFSRLWFSDFQCSKNKQSSKFLGLELLVAKIVKRLEFNDTFGFNHLAFVLRNMVHADQKMMDILKYLSIVRKEYRKSKMYESKLAQKASIRTAIEKCIENFCSDKGSIIRSILDRLFWKIVLDHLVVDDELVLNSDGIRLNVNRIMEGWTRKHVVPSVLFDLWARQYVPLDYIRDNAFSGVINVVGMSKLLVVVGGLSDDKAAGLSSIPNKL
ncbi:hypothetical protein G9A89_008286 [Geosiphon pyriformis]|nr:hypothetical protein G9A89_008286 [Geosiphon pyriformis]